MKNFLGYRKNSTRNLVIVDDESETVRIIFSLFLQGYGYRKIKEHFEKHNIKTATGKDTTFRQLEIAEKTFEELLSTIEYLISDTEK